MEVKILSGVNASTCKSKIWSYNRLSHSPVIEGYNQLCINVYDEDVGKDDEVGSAVLDLAPVFQRGVFDGYIGLRTPNKHKPAGEIRIVVYFRPVTGVGMQAAHPGGAPAYPAYPVSAIRKIYHNIRIINNFLDVKMT